MRRPSTVGDACTPQRPICSALRGMTVRPRGAGGGPSMAVESARRKRHTQFLLGGILPIDQKRIPVDVIAGATLAALAIPEVMGYAKIAGHAGDHRPVHADPAGRRCSRSSARRATSWSAPTRRPPRSSPSGLLATGAVAGLSGVHAAGLAGRPDVRGLPDPRPAPAARLHRQLPVAQRAHRLPDRRRHPGGDGPARRHVRDHRPEREHAREVLADPAGDPDPDQRARPRRVARRPRHDPRPRAGQQEDPGRPHRGRRHDRRELRLRPRRDGRHRPRHRARRPAARSACRPT